MMARTRGATPDMLLYPAEHHQPRPASEDEASPRHERSVSPLVNLLLALCGIALYLEGEVHGALVVLIVMAAFNAGMMLRR